MKGQLTINVGQRGGANCELWGDSTGIGRTIKGGNGLQDPQVIHCQWDTSSSFSFTTNISCHPWQMANLHSVGSSCLISCRTQNYSMQPPPAEPCRLCLTEAQIAHLFFTLSPFHCSMALLQMISINPSDPFLEMLPTLQALPVLCCPYIPLCWTIFILCDPKRCQLQCNSCPCSR